MQGECFLGLPAGLLKSRPGVTFASLLVLMFLDFCTNSLKFHPAPVDTYCVKQSSHHYNFTGELSPAVIRLHSASETRDRFLDINIFGINHVCLCESSGTDRISINCL